MYKDTNITPNPLNSHRVHIPIPRHMKKGFNNQTHCSRMRSDTPFLADEIQFQDLVDLAVLNHLSYHFDSKLYWVWRGRAKDLMVYLDRGRA